MTSYEAVIAADALVPLDRMLLDLGFSHDGFGEPLRCPIHKGGKETKPSAVLHPDNSVFCFKCGKQYGPTAIMAEAEGMSRAEAARQLLRTYPPEKEALEQVLRDVTTPAPKQDDFLPPAVVESTLLRYRGLVPLELYQMCARRIDAFTETLKSLDQKYHADTTSRFLRQLSEELEDGRRDPARTAP